MVHGFVEELVVNEDPEYQWIDRIRTPRASNEARQRLISLMSGKKAEGNFILVETRQFLPVNTAACCSFFQESCRGKSGLKSWRWVGMQWWATYSVLTWKESLG